MGVHALRFDGEWWEVGIEVLATCSPGSIGSVWEVADAILKKIGATEMPRV